MRKIKELFISSSKELKNLRCLTLIGMFCAISIVIGSFSIMLSEDIKISFTFLPNEFVYYLFGPVVGVIFGAVTDLLTFIISPKGPFFFGFTLSGMLTGLLYGVLLYKKPLSLVRVFLVNAIWMILIGILLNTYWLSILNGVNYFVLLSTRVPKELIMLPINTFLLYTVIKGVESTKILELLHNKIAKTKIN